MRRTRGSQRSAGHRDWRELLSLLLRARRVLLTKILPDVETIERGCFHICMQVCTCVRADTAPATMGVGLVVHKASVS